MTVTKLNGKWVVLDNSGTIISEHDTNSQAWRAMDRLTSEPISKREATADYIWRKGLDR